MASSFSSEDDVFDRLKAGVDPKNVQAREDAVRSRVRAQYERAQRTLAGLIDENSTLPVSISEIRIEGAKHTRKGFLEKVVAPALSKGKNGEGRSYTLATALEELHGRTNTLHRFGIFQPSISIYLDKKPSSTPTQTDLSVLLTVIEKSRLLLKTGTDVGNAEGTGYVNLTYRNVFGGAESLNGSASIGTRTRSAYELNFQSPINSNPGVVTEVGGYASTRSHQDYASHEEVLKGGKVGLKWGSGRTGEHEVGYTGVWRQVTGLKEASLSVRGDAGDTVKSSLNYSFLRDKRDNALLPSSGYLCRVASEVAGWGGLGGDVAFAKTQVESQGAVTVPGTRISVTAGVRGGLLYPLSLSAGGDEKTPMRPSRINDRFQLGGPTDVRGFRECGLGPKDGTDSVGGDVYIAGGASILFPLPKLAPEKPLRLQAFINGGRLVGLQGIHRERGGDVNTSIISATQRLTGEMPSVAAGFGIVYAHPVARFELNFCLPIITRPEDRARKGVQFGVGLNFL